MYIYRHPKPIPIELAGADGFALRDQAARYVAANLNVSGAERGSTQQQGYGALAEIIVRKNLGLPLINPAEHPIAYDFQLPTGVKVDVKCRGGVLPFQEQYGSSDGISREAKHNFFARQVYDQALNTDIYLLTHLTVAGDGSLPGTLRQRKWCLFVCGWVSKKRVTREGVYLPRGSLTEQGNTWFTYRGQEIEFYNKNLNGLDAIADLATVSTDDVADDAIKKGGLNLTSVDALRICYDLVGKGVLDKTHLDIVKMETGITQTVKPILQENQYFHLIEWMRERGYV
ncbi:hypothetical protein HY633_00495, partial [Candidatus Uhrbacteria bacterium]|nr:hypothetical protein [Candidatus Uhrbacteria bacterium]